MYKTKFVINITVCTCLHSNCCEFEIVVYLSLRERICSLNNFELAPLRIFCKGVYISKLFTSLRTFL